VAPSLSNRRARPGPTPSTTTRGHRVGLAVGQLVVEPGDRDPVRPARLDAGLDRPADVVDVHVDVPGAVAGADHHERVAEAGEPLAERVDGCVGGIEEVLDLVGELVGAGLAGPQPFPLRLALRRHPQRRTRRHGGPGDHLGEGVEQHTEAAPARVDDAGPGQRRQLLGVRASASRAAVAAAPTTTLRSPESAPVAASAAARATERTVPSTGVATARYAASAAAVSAAANARPSAAGIAASASARPRSNCDRITPELPRAPSSAPRAS
jgi:hypothetical protein